GRDVSPSPPFVPSAFRNRHRARQSGVFFAVEAPMSEHPPPGERELASFIRAGAERRPDQAYGDYFKGKSASCALGAAYEGMYRLPREMDGAHPTKDLEWFFDCLEGTVRGSPVEG